MGTVYEAECPKCGYKKSFHMGSGLFALQLHRHLRFFDEKEQEEILKMERENKIQRFQIENQLGYCRHCGTLQEKTVLFVKGTDKKDYIMGNCCGTCQEELVLYGEQQLGRVPCPGCGQGELKFSRTGQWD